MSKPKSWNNFDVVFEAVCLSVFFNICFQGASGRRNIRFQKVESTGSVVELSLCDFSHWMTTVEKREATGSIACNATCGKIAVLAAGALPF